MAQIVKLNDGTRGGALGELPIAKDPFTIFESPGDSITREVSSRQRIVFLRSDVDPFSNAAGNLFMKILGNADNETNVGKYEFAEHGGMLWRPLSANPITFEPGTFEGGSACMRASRLFGDAFNNAAGASWDLIGLPGIRLPSTTGFILPMLASGGVPVDKDLGNRFLLQSKEQLLTIAAAGTTVDSGITFPSKCLAWAVGTRIIDDPGNAGTMDVGIPADAVRFSTGLSTVLGQTNWGVAQTFTPLNAATSVRITLSVAATNQFQVGITIIYFLFSAGLSGVWDA